MPAPVELLDLYLHLARASEEQSKPLQRDKFLVLAGGAALASGYARVAEECRQRLLADNPNHILRNFGSMSDAFDSEDIQHYANQLLRTYPFEKAEYLLEKYRSSGYTSGHGYGAIVPVPDSKAGDSTGGARSGSSSSTASRKRGSARPVDSMDSFADFENEHAELLNHLDDFELSDLYRDGLEDGAALKRSLPTRIIWLWVAGAALAGVAVGILVGNALRHFGQ